MNTYPNGVIVRVLPSFKPGVAGRPTESAAADGDNFILDDQGKLLIFPDEAAAREFLRESGLSDADIDNGSLVFEEAEDTGDGDESQA
ncbi:MAG: hypothetical protein IJ849_09465 [Selenomonadaceae bacterium]|nr:hypothetical protein [Selenomonadaceae bacterium]